MGAAVGMEPARRGRGLEPGPAGRGVALVQPGTRRYALTVCRRVATMSAAGMADPRYRHVTMFNTLEGQVPAASAATAAVRLESSLIAVGQFAPELFWRPQPPVFPPAFCPSAIAFSAFGRYASSIRLAIATASLGVKSLRWTFSARWALGEWPPRNHRQILPRVSRDRSKRTAKPPACHAGATERPRLPSRPPRSAGGSREVNWPSGSVRTQTGGKTRRTAAEKL